MSIEHGRPARDQGVHVVSQRWDIGFPMSEHDVGIFARADPRSVASHEARGDQHLPVWHEEELGCFAYDPHDVHRDGRPVRRAGFIHLVGGVKPERERAPDRWDLVDGVLVDHHFVGRARIEHPPLHHDRSVDLSQVAAVGRTEDEGGLSAVVIAEQEVPDGHRSHLGLGPRRAQFGWLTPTWLGKAMASDALVCTLSRSSAVSVRRAPAQAENAKPAVRPIRTPRKTRDLQRRRASDLAQNAAARTPPWAAMALTVRATPLREKVGISPTG